MLGVMAPHQIDPGVVNHRERPRPRLGAREVSHCRGFDCEQPINFVI